ncbi:MBL fold metallo-hydrolase [Paracraurococcus lichenis]|uniref:MBL fold metallo-hydrolase n=1 Tax=Paracraurococcus lichenis TaxID=3064888 RepID=A0ABT9E7F2_9PROT|nr:MBL fold metallo-hydrolase [Paracraurococcus sp. LOR1-02]MDO9711885.1 MBL fold metallo-hydrolase [Paracraurococcus sp. LOR1-02]
MTLRRFCLVAAFGVAAIAGSLLGVGTTRAADDQDRHNARPPQTLPQGFEGTDRLLRDVDRAAGAPYYSAWLVESSRFVDVPFGSFMPDRDFISPTTPKHDIQFIDFPVNVGIIKGSDGQITLYDTGWKQLEYIFDYNTSCCWAGLPDQMRNIGLDPNAVTRIVVGHGHWDHSGQLDSFPNAVLYIQKEELKQIDFFTSYPTEFNNGIIRAVNTVNPLTGAQVGPPAQACARSPVCGYPPQTIQEIESKVLTGKAKIIDGRHEIAPGLVIHPAFRGHTYGSQLLQVHTKRGELVFGSDAYSSWEGIRDWNVANIQQTDTVQQMLAYEKCYVLTSGSESYNNCLGAHERLSYSANYPITANWWTITDGNCSRAAELTLADSETSLIPADVATGSTRITPPALGGKSAPWRIDPVTCKNTISAVPSHSVNP